MATSSIFHNIVIKSVKEAERLLVALEMSKEASQNGNRLKEIEYQMPYKEIHGDEIDKLFNEGGDVQ